MIVLTRLRCQGSFRSREISSFRAILSRGWRVSMGVQSCSSKQNSKAQPQQGNETKWYYLVDCIEWQGKRRCVSVGVPQQSALSTNSSSTSSSHRVGLDNLGNGRDILTRPVVDDSIATSKLESCSWWQYQCTSLSFFLHVTAAWISDGTLESGGDDVGMPSWMYGKWSPVVSLTYQVLFILNNLAWGNRSTLTSNSGHNGMQLSNLVWYLAINSIQ